VLTRHNLTDRRDFITGWAATGMRRYTRFRCILKAADEKMAGAGQLIRIPPYAMRKAHLGLGPTRHSDFAGCWSTTTDMSSALGKAAGGRANGR